MTKKPATKPTPYVVFVVFLIFMLVSSAIATIGLGLFIDGSYFFSLGWIMWMLALSVVVSLIGAIVHIFSPLRL